MYAILVNTSGNVALMGTGAGRLFRTKEAADKAANRYEKHHPVVQAMVLALEPFAV